MENGTLPPALELLKQSARLIVASKARYRFEMEEAAANESMRLLRECVTSALPREVEKYINWDFEQESIFDSQTRRLAITIELPDHWPILVMFTRQAGRWRHTEFVSSVLPIDGDGGQWTWFVVLVNHGDQMHCERYGCVTLGAALVRAEREPAPF